VYKRQVLEDPETPADIKTAARYNRALILLDRGDAAARTDLEALTESGPHAEEAMHHLAVLRFEEEDHTGCQTAIFNQLNRFGAGSDWSFHSFLLLAETYIAQEDYFQARSTVDQLDANVEEPWVQEACMDLRDRIHQLEHPEPIPADSTAAPIQPDNNDE